MTEYRFLREGDLLAHVNASPAHPASAISFDPTGLENITANNVQDAIEELEGNTRTRLTDNLSLYLSPLGNDTTGDGSLANPWRHPQKAADFIAEQLDLSDFQVRINMADGSYNGVYNRAYFGGGEVYWRGNKLVPGNVIMGNALSHPAGFVLGSMNLLERTTTEVSFNGIRLEPDNRPAIDADPSTCGDNSLNLIDSDLDDPDYIACCEIAGVQANSTCIFGNFFDGGFTPTIPSIVVDGSELVNAGALMHTLHKGVMFLGSTIRIDDSPSFSNAVMIASQDGFISDFATWSGAGANGRRWLVAAGGIFQAGNGLAATEAHGLR